MPERDEVKAARERYRRLRQWESANFKPFDGDPYKDSRKVICPMTELLSDDLNTLADAYLALHADEKVKERRELIEIFDAAIEVIAGKQTCRRVVAALEELT